MRRLLPSSLVGQIAIVMALALLVAQAINFTLIYSERQRFNRARLDDGAIVRFVILGSRLAGLDPHDRAIAMPQRIRRGQIMLGDHPAISAQQADPRLTARLRDTIEAQSAPLSQALASGEENPSVVPAMFPHPDAAMIAHHPQHFREIRLSARFPDGRWFNARMLLPKPTPWLALRPAIATLLTYLIILAAMIWLAARLARPLRDLTRAARSFQGHGEPEPVEARGPADIRRAVVAFNDMGRRVSSMLDEKDRMLGAIGHDLRTPLASLRIRAENVEPGEERQRMIATIEEMAATLHDILALARSRRASEEQRMVDLGALADSVVEDFREMGEAARTEPGERVTANVQPRLLRRALRNLVENAIKYGGEARVATLRRPDGIAVEIRDRGPGIPPEALQQVQEPFYRLEKSRNRDTGGAGLGLALARAAALAHGGRLELENIEGGGLCARLVLPG